MKIIRIIISFILIVFLVNILRKVFKEGFDNSSVNNWSPELIRDFLNFQSIYNPTFTFDTNILQKQATPEEVNYLFNNKKWPWSQETKQLYKETIMNNNIISVDPEVSLTVSQSIYNENAIKQILSWKTKEGLFLLNGAIIGHTENLPDNINNLAKCVNNNGDFIMKKIINKGYGSINGEMIKTITEINNEDIPYLVPGFKFINKPCNPCGPLNDPTDYSCPFSINVGDGNGISRIWKTIWNSNS